MNDLESLSDLELADLYRKGCIEAFAVLYERHFDRTRSACQAIVYNEHISKDLAHDAFMRAITKIDNFSYGSFGNFVNAIANHLAIDYYKRKQEVPIEGQDPPDDGSGPSDIAEKEERKEAVQNAVKKLPEQIRSVIKGFYFHGLSYEDIAKSLKLTENQVGYLLLKGRNAMSRLLHKFR